VTSFGIKHYKQKMSFPFEAYWKLRSKNMISFFFSFILIILCPAK
jgi:hypothetical protein